jgi:hypothetical protein
MTYAKSNGAESVLVPACVAGLLAPMVKSLTVGADDDVSAARSGLTPMRFEPAGMVE